MSKLYSKFIMTIVVTLRPELEALLRDKATQQGQDIGFFASELLASILESEAQDVEEAVKGIQKGLDEFESGQFRSFHEFAEEKRQKYNLSVDS
jgi:hypothetical protein